jgi:glutamine cyclotransferase
MARIVLMVLLTAAAFTATLLGAAENAAGVINASNIVNVAIPTYGYEILNTYPHDREAFTQGLDYDEGVLYESTGLYGRSTLRTVDLKTGRVQKQINLPAWFFGEGVTVFGDRLIQLTWQSFTGLVYQKDNLSSLGDFSYRTEGWGITSDGRHLIMSDGTDTLYMLDPYTFNVTGTITVSCNGRRVDGLNELEYVKGEIYANIYTTNKIAIISPENGQVRAWIDLTGLLSEEESRNADVLNGIACYPKNDTLLVTGKLWPKLFEIRVVPK